MGADGDSGGRPRLTHAAPGLSHDWETERLVLACVIMDPGRFGEAAEVVRAEDFSRSQHAALWTLCADLVADGRPCDSDTVLSAAMEAKRLEEFGGIAYLMGLFASVPTPEFVAEHAATVRRHADRRRVVLALRSVLDRVAAEPDIPPAEIADAAVAACQGVRAGMSAERTWDRPSADVGQLYDDARAAMERPGEIRGLRTGLSAVDDILRGLRRGCVYLLGGRPGAGKTAAMGGLTLWLARRQRVTVGVFSLEMSRLQLSQRWACSVAGVSAEAVESGTITPAAWADYTAALDTVAELPLLVDDTAALTIQELRSRARGMVREGAQLICVDYAQLVRPVGRYQREDQGLAEVSMGLLALAKDLDVPVLALVQLNRGVEGRSEKRPGMADIKGAGQFEQDAYGIIGLYRPIVYGEGLPDEAEWIVLKHRGGRTGTAKVRFDAPTMTFRDEARWG